MTLFRRNNISVAGIAGAELLETEPAGYRPRDLLASAQSMLCLGMAVPRGIFKSNGRAQKLYWRAANIYYRNIDAILMRAAGIIEEKGETAVPVFG